MIRESLPDCSGTYVLVLESCTFAELAIGRLGTLHLEPGCYLYVGSAFGPGGIAARVGRHAQTEKTARWHIDYLRERTRLVEVWYQCGDVHHEAQWAEARVQSERAFHAAEAGLRIIIASVLAGESPPVEGTVVSVGVSVVEFVEVPESGQSGEVVLEGRAGTARRRLSVIVQ